MDRSWTWFYKNLPNIIAYEVILMRPTRVVIDLIKLENNIKEIKKSVGLQNCNYGNCES